MKELSIEQKAKAYDEAIERARYWEKNPTVWSSDDICQKLFPELKESEDERIRKEMIEILEKEARDFPSSVIAEKSNSWIAWLKKQSTTQVRTGLEWVNTIDDACDKRYSEEYAHGEYCHEQSFKWGFQEGVDWLDWFEKKGNKDEKMLVIKDHIDAIKALKEAHKIELEKQGEQKFPIEKLPFEMKTVSESLGLTSKKECDDYNKMVTNLIMSDDKGKQKPAPKYKIGDTIYFNSFGKVQSMIVANIVEDGTDNPMYEDKDGNSVFEKDLVEQKPTVEIKTPEESLGIDSDTYNKIVDECIYGEQKPEKKLLSNIVGFVKFPFKAKMNNKIVTICDGQTNMDGTLWVGFVSDSEDGYKLYRPEELEIIEQKELKKEKVDNLHNYLYGEQNPAWSEEDEEMLKVVIKSCEQCGNEYAYYWLKSLKDRYTWKPSKRQKEALLWCVVHLGGADKQTLGELLETLNKL